MNKVILIIVFAILVGCSDKKDSASFENSNIKSEYIKNTQKQVDVAKSEVVIPTNIGSPELATCAAASMKIGKGIGVYKVWVDALSSRYSKTYPEKSRAEIEQYTSDRISDKLNYLKSNGYETQEAFVKYYELNCKN